MACWVNSAEAIKMDTIVDRVEYIQENGGGPGVRLARSDG